MLAMADCGGECDCRWWLLEQRDVRFPSWAFWEVWIRYDIRGTEWLMGWLQSAILEEKSEKRSNLSLQERMAFECFFRPTMAFELIRPRIEDDFPDLVKWTVPVFRVRLKKESGNWKIKWWRRVVTWSSNYRNIISTHYFIFNNSYSK